MILIDEFTGRMMQGRRLSEGLHQAIEAKEGAVIQPENQTLASVTIQNYFRLYDKLSGMTGTAATEAQEFVDIYKMDVAEIPTNRPVAADRRRRRGLSHRRREEPRRSPPQIEDCYRRGQPILVGTVSIEKSEQLSETARRPTPSSIDGKTHQGHPAQRAERPLPRAGSRDRRRRRRAGRGDHRHQHGRPRHRHPAGRQRRHAAGQVARGAARRWASRPTPSRRWPSKAEIEAEIADLKQQALAAGGLFVLGTERHESRRIDNQLRGRTGRQGDPGRSKFFLSCEDDLLRIFAGERLDAIMRTFGVQEGEAITHKWLNSAIATAQKRVEQRNYEIRKNLLKYDDVVNDQRKAVFEQRQEFMEATDLVGDHRRDARRHHRRPGRPPPAAQGLCRAVGRRGPGRAACSLPGPAAAARAEWAAEDGIANEEIEERILEAAEARAAERDAAWSATSMRSIEKSFLLQTIDLQWREHLMHLDHLRNGDRPARLRPARPAERVQDRGLLAVREAAGRPAPERDPLADDGGVPVRGAAEPPHAPADLRGPPGPADRRERARARLRARRHRPPSSAQALPVSRPAATAGRTPAATRPAPAARARSSSTATGRWSKRSPLPCGGGTGWHALPVAARAELEPA